MLKISYITRPYFHDIALELIQELKKQSILTVVIVLSPWNVHYLGIEDEDLKEFGESFELTERIEKKILEKHKSYFDGATILLKYEERKTSNLKNTLRWKKLLTKKKGILSSDLIIMESFSSFADWYLLFKIRKKNLYYIMHDPVPHSGEENKRISIRHLLFDRVSKFLLYSCFSTDLFKKHFPEYASKTLTLSTPVYHNLVASTEANKVSDDAISILFFGRISPYKGVELFYNAAEELIKEFKNVKFIIAGKAIPGYSPEFLKNKPNDKIEIINQFIELDMLAKLMSESHLCVLPYTDATQSGVVMTCYAYNLPVLVSDCAGLLEYCFDPENFSFENGNLTDLKNKIRHILTNNDLINAYKDKIKAYDDKNVARLNVNKILSI